MLSISKATAESIGGKAINSCPKPEDRPLGLALDATCIEPIGYVPAIRDGPGLAFHGDARPPGDLVRRTSRLDAGPRSPCAYQHIAVTTVFFWPRD